MKDFLQTHKDLLTREFSAPVQSTTVTIMRFNQHLDTPVCGTVYLDICVVQVRLKLSKIKIKGEMRRRNAEGDISILHFDFMICDESKI